MLKLSNEEREDAMFLIGEMSRITQVSLRMLRYYDKNDLFKPKVVDEWTGYRYYTADQIDDLYRIVQLRDLGFTINEIAQLIQIKEKTEYIKRLQGRKEDILKEIQASKDRLARMNAYLEDLLDDTNPELSIVMKSIPDKEVISLRRRVEDYYCEAELWAELTKRLEGMEINEKTESFSLYHDLDDREEEVDMEVCIVCPKNQVVPEGLIHRQVPGTECAVSLMIGGPYRKISKAYQAFGEWLESHPEYEMVGPNRQICHVSECDTDNEQEYLTELLIPLHHKNNS